MHSEPPNDDDHCCNTDLIFSAAKLDVCRRERLAYTEPPSNCINRRAAAKRAALLKAMATWALAHL
jgi:hypothetical protein